MFKLSNVSFFNSPIPLINDSSTYSVKEHSLILFYSKKKNSIIFSFSKFRKINLQKIQI
jgi:hypothetical protein